MQSLHSYSRAPQLFLHCVYTAFDGINVKLAETYDMFGMMAKFDLVQKVDLLSIADIQKKVCAHTYIRMPLLTVTYVLCVLRTRV